MEIRLLTNSDRLVMETTLDELTRDYDTARRALHEAQAKRDEAMWALDVEVETAESKVRRTRTALHRKLGIDT